MALRKMLTAPGYPRSDTDIDVSCFFTFLHPISSEGALVGGVQPNSVQGNKMDGGGRLGALEVLVGDSS